MVPFKLDAAIGRLQPQAEAHQTAPNGGCNVSSVRYLDVVTFELPDQHLQGLNATPGQLRLATAVGLYTSGDVTLGQAALLAGVSQTQFLHELGRRGISVNYSLEDLEQDLKTIEILHPELHRR